jgi:hypothetical protein
MRMETKQTISAETENRRSFLKETGKKALWAAPLVTMIMTASSQRAKAGDSASGCDYTQSPA